MIYNIKLTITHRYSAPAANSRHVIRVLPPSIAGRQQLLNHQINITPLPEARAERVDFFANASTTFTQQAAHDEMVIQLSCHVDIAPPLVWRDRSCDVGTLQRHWQDSRDLSAQSPLHFLGPTPRLAPDAMITDFAQSLFAPRDTVVANVITIGRAVFDAMTFDARATDVTTDAAEAFRLRRGVCQDFSQIMILALQALGIPAGYVSGYLRTHPPKGGVKLAGVDAMHAWVRAWCGPDMGWIEYDPTNATLVGTDHIVAGYGRDYADIAPVSGHLRAAGGQQNTQAVDVTLVG